MTILSVRHYIREWLRASLWVLSPDSASLRDVLFLPLACRGLASREVCRRR